MRRKYRLATFRHHRQVFDWQMRLNPQGFQFDRLAGKALRLHIENEWRLSLHAITECGLREKFHWLPFPSEFRARLKCCRSTFSCKIHTGLIGQERSGISSHC